MSLARGSLMSGSSRRTKAKFFSALRATFVIAAFLFTFIFYGHQSGSSDIAGSSDHFGQRHLLQVTNENVSDSDSSNKTGNDTQTSSEDDPLFPSDLFTDEQLKNGAVILHVIGIVYMFYALALVCDEFFVPSLDVIAETLEISPDVAGATFMAAGGSAPELFTSVIGVFIAKSDVGIGTIVGSAVFNILFVIAACAFAAKEALSLTAWPLIRDVFFYSVSLIVLVIFFLDESIQWWEALILFLWYGAYVSFMKFNEPVEDALRSLLRLEPVDREGKEKGVTLRAAQYRKGLFHLMNETINPGLLTKKERKQQTLSKDGCDGEELKPLNNPKKEELVIGDQVAGIAGLKTQLQVPGTTTTTSTADVSIGANVAAEEMDETKMGDAEVTQTSPLNGAKGGKLEDGEDDDEDGEDPIDMSFPKEGGWKKIVYLISFPIMAPLFITLPDTKKKEKKKYFVVTFLGSIIWIALYSYLMVWWATVTGNVIGIPSQVMGLTFLAAGTSVPDLITSVLVAKQGKGDMAVSSSVGSNIFDVTVGLPLPWLLYTIIKWEAVSVVSEGVGCSVSLLFLMLIFVFLAIVAFKWKMTKGMGVVMLILYFLFVIVTLGFSYKFYECPI